MKWAAACTVSNNQDRSVIVPKVGVYEVLELRYDISR
jgi:hypothetical protein